MQHRERPTVCDPCSSLFWGAAGAETQTEWRSTPASPAVSGATSYFAQLVMLQSVPRETAVPDSALLDGGDSDAAARWVGRVPCSLQSETMSRNGLVMLNRAMLPLSHSLACVL